jgi:hypothetical protein
LFAWRVALGTGVLNRGYCGEDKGEKMSSRPPDM